MQNEIRYKSIVQCIPNGMFMVDREKKIITWNSAAETIFGLTADEVLGKTCIEAMICNEPADACPLFDDKIEKPVVEYECRISLPGRKLSLLKNIEVIKGEDDTIHGGIETFIDVTNLKRLEDRVVAAEAMAESAKIHQMEFLANLSHEIRTPMNGVMGLLDLAIETGTDSKQLDYLKMAKGSSAALMHLLNDMMDFSKIESGNIRLAAEVIDLNELIQSTVTAQMAEIEKSGLTVEMYIAEDIPIQVYGDPSRLRQILTNLLSNALKFTDTGAITIDLSKADEKNALSHGNRNGDHVWLLFSISDTGVGIAENQRHRIFEAFTQVDGSKNRNHGGVGLGLSICRRLVEMMDGHIRVQSGVGEGSTFNFTLPMLPADNIFLTSGGRRSHSTPVSIRFSGQTGSGQHRECSTSADFEGGRRRSGLEELAQYIAANEYQRIEKLAEQMRKKCSGPDRSKWSDDLFRLILSARKKDTVQLDRLLSRMKEQKENRSCGF